MKWKRLVSLCLTLVLLVLLAVPAGAVGTVEIAFPGGQVFPYTGAAHTPPVRVTLDGAVQEGYTVTYENNVDAGQATVRVSGDGWEETAQFTILPKVLEGDSLTMSCTKAYDGTTEARPDIRAQGVGGRQIPVAWTTASYGSKFVGGAIPVTASGLTIHDSNYTLSADSFQGLGRINPVEPRFAGSARIYVGETLDLRSLVTHGGDLQFDYQGTLNGTLFTGTAPGTETVIVYAAEAYVNSDDLPEYTGGTGEIRIHVLDKGGTPPGQTTTPPEVPVPPEAPSATGKLDQPALTLRGDTAVTCGQTLRFSVGGGAGSGAVTYGVLSGDNVGAGTITAEGLFTPTHPGTVRISATKAGDDRYREATASALEVRIHPAVITITVGDKTALVGDPVPTLGRGDYTVTGLLAGDSLQTEPTLRYAATPDMSRAGILSILASGAQVPGSVYDPNIIYRSGLLTVSEKPLYPIRVEGAAHGSLTADQTAAREDDWVTITALPEEGYVLQSLGVTGQDGASIPTREIRPGQLGFSMPACAVTVSAVFVPLTPTLPFADVGEGDWFYDAVAWVYAQGLMKGTTDRAFSPHLTTSRGMIVTILHRMEGEPPAPGWAPFGDVAPGQYYAGPVAWAAWNGIVNGKTAAAFGPNDPITREQFAAILYRYGADEKDRVSHQGSLSQFRDRDKVSPYAREALAWAVGEGLLTGTGGGVLDPRGPATRAQAAAILMRFCQAHPGEDPA